MDIVGRFTEAVAKRFTANKMCFVNSQENASVRISYSIKFHAMEVNFFKKRLRHRPFPVNFRNLIQTVF